ncbi:MAG: flavodoxin-dependent (E)-4-hydroxy-3-methylbut-2-enyl-diphosphate synthase [Pirellulales bacterium]|nr:flavodoxin-dependent (E)-4-hydroxy-3-methylbut-2-enyl-diphosphate synthase [Pirellulales bacterium]
MRWFGPAAERNPVGPPPNTTQTTEKRLLHIATTTLLAFLSKSEATLRIKRNPTREVRIGSVTIGAGHPIVVQSMCATKTTNVEATVEQIDRLAAAGAGVVRLAVDNQAELRALVEIRRRTTANLSVDLQENYRLAVDVAPWVDKIRYNPGHLGHSEPERSWQDKVRTIVDAAAAGDCALRIGVNCGSIDPAKTTDRAADDQIGPMLESVSEHCELLDSLGFRRYCVSLKDSNPARVVALNRRFAAERPDVPIHLGVTEAGMPPEGILKTRRALEPLLAEGIGDTLRVSLTVPNDRKQEEIEAGRQILARVAAGEGLADDAPPADEATGLNIISCPSCSRVENERFVELAGQIREMTRYAAPWPITIAVMGCRVNGPGETDHADLGVWCGPQHVRLKRGTEPIGSFGYDEILARLKIELDRLIEART